MVESNVTVAHWQIFLSFWRPISHALLSFLFSFFFLSISSPPFSHTLADGKKSLLDRCRLVTRQPIYPIYRMLCAVCTLTKQGCSNVKVCALKIYSMLCVYMCILQMSGKEIGKEIYTYSEFEVEPDKRFFLVAWYYFFRFSFSLFKSHDRLLLSRSISNGTHRIFGLG